MSSASPLSVSLKVFWFTTDPGSAALVVNRFGPVVCVCWVCLCVFVCVWVCEWK